MDLYVCIYMYIYTYIYAYTYIYIYGILATRVPHLMYKFTLKCTWNINFSFKDPNSARSFKLFSAKEPYN